MKENFYFYQIYFLGSYAGSVAGTLVAGYLCEVCGWNWVFYVFGNYLEWFVYSTNEETKNLRYAFFLVNFIRR